MQDVYGIAVARCEVLVFVLLDERRQNLETVAISGFGHGFGFEITGYFADSPVVILFIVERLTSIITQSPCLRLHAHRAYPQI